MIRTKSSKRRNIHQPQPTPSISNQLIHDSHENGRNYWNFMHTVAAYYPSSPTSEQISKMIFFINRSATYFLTKEEWKRKFLKNVQDNPPKLQNQHEFSIWLCHQHNLINKEIGKHMFICSLENLQQRWGPSIQKQQEQK